MTTLVFLPSICPIQTLISPPARYPITFLLSKKDSARYKKPAFKGRSYTWETTDESHWIMLFFLRALT
jgi:hypothetical protein